MNLDRRQFLGLGAAGVTAATLARGLSWSTLASAAPIGAGVWKFGIMSDTQWKANLDGENPGTCAVGIIRKLNEQFINHGVKFVIQVGDLCDSETNAINKLPNERTMHYRADAAKPLYDAGIGFFPLRGNHESSKDAANELPTLFPQTSGKGAVMAGATNFTSPSAALQGLSYSYDVNDMRFVMLDQFTRRDGSNYGTGPNDNMVDQVPWVDQRISGRTNKHSMVFAHKNLIGQNHTDTLFGADPAANPAARNAFISSLQRNGVRYTIGGHDHVHHRSLVVSPDGASQVKQLIGSSNSYKFYTPKVPSNAETSKQIEKIISQELWTIGYYIVTVAGPLLWVDYYSSTHGSDYGDIDLEKTPTNTRFFHREQWGYGLNGKEFVIEQGASYTAVKDAYASTKLAILDGQNNSTAVDYAKRKMVKTVNTGWETSDDKHVASAICHLWGTNDNLALNDDKLTGLLPDSDGPRTGDTFVISMSFDGKRGNGEGNAGFRLSMRTTDGSWVEAGKAMTGSGNFVPRAWRKGDPLGTYGVDSSTNTAWAVVNSDGVYAVTRGGN